MKDKREYESRREEYADATRSALIEAGREAFFEKGFGSAGIEAIARAARVTRGAFYHHFKDKKALFEQIVLTIQMEAAARVEKRARQKKDLLDRLFAGIDEYLDVCIEPEYTHIVIREAKTVLGEDRYRQIEDQCTMALLKANLLALKEKGIITFDNIELLSRLIDAMICELSIVLTTADKEPEVREQGILAIQKLLESFQK